MLIDMHIHTSESDGTDSPEELIQKAIGMKMDLLSITDHNTISAYEKLLESPVLADFSGQLITGAEFCVNFGTLLVEILGYGFDLVRMQSFIDKRFNKQKMAEKEKELFLEIREKLLRKRYRLDPELAYQPPFATEAFEKELWRYPENLQRFPAGLIPYPEMLYRYMNDPSSDLYMFDSYFPPCAEVVAAIQAAGGLAFLAHPCTYLVADQYHLVEEIIADSSLDGVEIFYALHSGENIQRLLEIVNKHRLYASGGSDYHGQNKPHIKLGSGLGNLVVPEELIGKWAGHAKGDIK